jgi:hypothetical protein
MIETATWVPMLLQLKKVCSICFGLVWVDNISPDIISVVIALNRNSSVAIISVVIAIKESLFYLFWVFLSQISKGGKG